MESSTSCVRLFADAKKQPARIREPPPPPPESARPYALSVMAVTFLGLGLMSLIEFHGSLDVAFDKSRGLTSQNAAALRTSMRSTPPRTGGHHAPAAAGLEGLLPPWRSRPVAGQGSPRAIAVTAADALSRRLRGYVSGHRPMAARHVRAGGSSDRSGEGAPHSERAPTAKLGRAGAAERLSREAVQARFEPLRLVTHATPDRRRPVALYEIVAAVRRLTCGARARPRSSFKMTPTTRSLR
jgi:hypothetical protein